jgi:hypothetical protein
LTRGFGGVYLAFRAAWSKGCRAGHAQRRKSMRGAVGIVLVLAAAACAPVSNGGGEAEMAELLPSVQVTTGDDSVELLLQVTNTTGAPVPLTFPSGQSYDFVVYDGTAREVWRWSAGQMFTQAVREESLAPGETRTYREVWVPEPGTAGAFEVEGVLTVSGRDVRQRTGFRIP